MILVKAVVKYQTGERSDLWLKGDSWYWKGKVEVSCTYEGYRDGAEALFHRESENEELNLPHFHF